MNKVITAAGRRNTVEIIDGGKGFFATVMRQGTEIGNSKSFKTLNGAEKWANLQLA